MTDCLNTTWAAVLKSRLGRLQYTQLQKSMDDKTRLCTELRDSLGQCIQDLAWYLQHFPTPFDKRPWSESFVISLYQWWILSCGLYPCVFFSRYFPYFVIKLIKAIYFSIRHKFRHTKLMFIYVFICFLILGIKKHIFFKNFIFSVVENVGLWFVLLKFFKTLQEQSKCG